MDICEHADKADFRFVLMSSCQVFCLELFIEGIKKLFAWPCRGVILAVFEIARQTGAQDQ